MALTFSELNDNEQHRYIEDTATWAANARKARNEQELEVSRAKDYTRPTRDEIGQAEQQRVDNVVMAQPTPQSIRDKP